jgi:2-succinyl-6-hydroxy-2,4-cyclohexadiene-1-carboxylate synthase
MGSSKDWHEIIDLLVDSCLCLAIDLPGHGKSTCLKNPGAYTFSETAAQVVRVMEMTKAVPATVMGYSMGGRIALYVALQYRHACSKLVIESATAGIVDEGERAKRKALDRDRAQEISRGKFEDFVRTWYCQPVFQTLAENPERLDGMGVGMQPSLWGRLHELPIPTLLIAGEKDSKYVGIVQSMAALIPKGRAASVPEAGHNAHLENPDLVAEYTKDFILKE